MTNVKPCEKLDVRIPDLDDYKRQFIDQINTTLDTIQNVTVLSEVLVRLSVLAHHASQYFRFEEAFLCHKLDKYEFSDHRLRHLFFENSLRAPVIQKTDQVHCDTKELITFIADWMNFHIQYVDQRLYEIWSNTRR